MSEAGRLAEDLRHQFMNDETNFDTMIEASIELRRLAAVERELEECKAAYESQFKELHAIKASLGEPVAWYEHNPDLDAWFLAYSKNPNNSIKSRPLVFGDAAMKGTP